MLCVKFSGPFFPHHHVGLRSNTNHTTLCVVKTVYVFFNAHILFIHPAPGFILPHCAKFSKQNKLTVESYNLEQWTAGECLNLRGQLAYVFSIFSAVIGRNPLFFQVFYQRWFHTDFCQCCKLYQVVLQSISKDFTVKHTFLELISSHEFIVNL